MSTRPSRPVVLTKGGSARISLAKADPEAKITCTLSWQGRENGQRSDLDLFALHVPAEAVSSAAAATTDAVDHRTLGSLTAAPHLLHSGDSTAPGSETVTIGRLDRHGYILLCAYSAVSNGVGSFRSYQAEITVTDHRGQTVTCTLSEESDKSYWCAFALIDLTDPAGARIRNVENYSGKSIERSPLLRTDGSFEMDKGPFRFKGLLGLLTRRSKPLS
ncbi:uncharacterized protein involved in tellurium resistance [Kitasatospora gansuensis]|uniref:Uncharacterized protein involved in tellurium resistance n=1 Tax=Kitasatospora gansuensis TaxID=258050 RepID=A0A7W7SMA4_9ACTN|nr:hypothetical protein [Kitasatospora gansuensis]MBB4951896.1 uncharacterized protein involved in tellurium resistance [Kitasatospora gansuensis]